MYRDISPTGCVAASLVRKNALKTVWYRQGLSLTFAATVAIATQTLWLGSKAYAQTPTSDIYAFTNLHDLANLGGNDFSSAARDISNGVIVGAGIGNNTGNKQFALRWNADGTVTNLHSQGNFGSNTYSSAAAISNGVAVGFWSGGTGSKPDHAVRWNADGTVTDLHVLANLSSTTISGANDISNGARLDLAASATVPMPSVGTAMAPLPT